MFLIPKPDARLTRANVGGVGISLYLMTLCFVAMLMAFLAVCQAPLYWYNVHVSNVEENLKSWSRAFIGEQEKEKCKCLDFKTEVEPLLTTGKLTTWPEGFGATCYAHDKTECQPRYDYINTQYGTWCCTSWCYVDGECPFSHGSSVAIGLFYCYDCCKDQNDLATIQSCPWQTGIEYAGEALSDNREWPTAPKEIGSPGNHGVNFLENDEIEGRDGSWFPTVTVCAIFFAQFLVSILYFQVFRKVVLRFDENANTPSDYALLVKGLPPTETEEEIQNFFAKGLKNISKDCEDNDVLRVVLDTKFNIEPEEFAKQPLSVQQKLFKGVHSGICIVVFRKQICNRLVLEYLKQRDEDGKRNRIKHGRNLLLIKRAPEPVAIQWTMLRVQKSERDWRHLLAYVGSTLLIPLTMVGIFYLTDLKTTKGMELANLDKGTPEYDKLHKELQYIRYVVVVSITLINLLLEIGCKKLSSLERADSIPQLQSHLMIKLVFVTLANSVISMLIFNPTPKQWFLQDSLAFDLLYLTASESFVPPLLNLIQLPEIIRRLKFLVLKQIKTIEGPALLKYTQKLEMEYDSGYASAIRLTCLVLIFSALSPLMSVIAFFGLVFQRLVDKHTILHVRRSRYRDASSAEKVFLFITMIGLIVSPLSQYWFSYLTMTHARFKVHRVVCFFLAAFGFVLTLGFVFREQLKIWCYIRLGWNLKLASMSAVQSITYPEVQRSWEVGYNKGGYHRSNPWHKVARAEVIPYLL